jgi:hypothetical protein
VLLPLCRELALSATGNATTPLPLALSINPTTNSVAEDSPGNLPSMQVRDVKAAAAVATVSVFEGALEG